MKEWPAMWLIPLILLVLIALHHGWRMRYRGQSPWKGGGFAMFSELWRDWDITELWVKNPGEDPISLLIVDQQLNPIRQKACMIPTAQNWKAWARWIADVEWKRCGKFAHVLFGFQEGEAISPSKVTVRHRQLEFDCATGIHRAKDLKTYTVDCLDDSRRPAR